MAQSIPLLIAQSSSIPLQWLDVLILAASVIGVTAFGMWIGRKEQSTGDYYLAGKAVAWWAVAGPLVISFLLLRVSGVPLLEKDIGKRRPRYADYVLKTNAFFPGPPRK